MDVSFEQLKSLIVFATVVERGTFSAAGRQLGLSRAVVSYHINKLEKLYGLRLFNRSTRVLHLTEAGEKLSVHCRVIMAEAQAAKHAVERFKSEPEGSLRLSCPVSIGLERMVPILSAFRQLYPKISLNVSFTDAVADILQDSIDLAIRGAPLPDSGLQATRLARIKTCLCAAPGYLKAHGRPQTVDELLQHEWVVYERGQPLELQLKDGKVRQIALKGSVTTNNAAARTAFVEAGHGLGRIPRYDADPRIRAGKLEEILPGLALPDIQLFGVFPPGASTSKNLRLLIDFTKQSFQQSAFPAEEA
ncbi:transcriptional regulator, LysR family [Roseibium hamelinense]|uniref:Transcriptional regulator, LysR family n=1 Tax=Roseibium hamelinense TaxID=150831 RepID=A0A562THM0_9HYPH|nr:LysR family transcriptional regulator [Roseibium hamelinense]MTI45958.1 LysR family transcriptional regulator [Roseibium hamelinense]TWI92853.1 transcriptional regulator, LysR family [Roseibium hamelinense]